MVQYFFDRVENVVGKDKMLVTRIFSVFNNVFKRFLLPSRLNLTLCSKGLINVKQDDQDITVLPECV